MYSAGLRRSELMQLTPNAIDSERMVVRIKGGKGRKDRESLLSPKALILLRSYYKTFRPKTFLFEPAGAPGSMYAARTIDQIVKKSSLRANIRKNVSCHTLRHSFATHLLEQGVNIRIIQSFMGHTSLKTTSIYLHISSPNTKSIVSPLDSMIL
jgi:integrase/recombinase XerD